MAQYEIEVDSQDEFYESNEHQQQLHPQPPPPPQQQVNNNQIKSVVKRKGRGFSAEEPSTQILGGIKHFDTVREEVSGRAIRCKSKIYTDNYIFYSLYHF